MSVAAFAHGVTSDFVAAPDVTTLPTPTIDAPVFSQVPKSVQVEAGKDATFTAQAGVGDGGAISYAWQHKGVSEQEFTAVEPGDKYAIATDPATGVTTLTVKGVGAEQVGAFRCVATNSNSGQTVSAASAAAYLAVTPVKPTDLKSRATSPTTGEVTWKANGEVRRFVVRYSRVKFNGKDVVEPERSMVVTIPDDAAEGACQLDGLEPNSEYSVLIDAAPQGRVHCFGQPSRNVLHHAACERARDGHGVPGQGAGGTRRNGDVQGDNERGRHVAGAAGVPLAAQRVRRGVGRRGRRRRCEEGTFRHGARGRVG